MLPEELALKLKCLLAMFLITILLFGCAVSPAEAPDVSAGVDACGLRGWDLNAGYQYVIMGWYPYDKDPAITKKNANDPAMYDPKTYSEDAKAPVLWQVLSVEDGKALLYTTYIIDAHQPTEVDNEKDAKGRKYPEITDYGETDLNRWLNDTMIYDLLGDEPVLAAVTEEQYGRLYPLTDGELMTEKYGFTAQRFYEVKSRWAYATPYALNKKQHKKYGSKLSKDSSYGTSDYWVAALKRDSNGNQLKGRYLQLCAGIADPHEKGGTNIGHLSFGYLNRTTVGLRVALRLDTSKIQVISGNGSIWDPCRLALVEEKEGSKAVVTPPLREGPTPVPTTPAPVKDRPRLETPGPDVTPVPVPEWAQ